LKSVFFAAALGLIACQRGLSTRGGAAGVGRATTSAVVVVLFALVLLDAVFTYVFSLLDW
jgi:phospholipid/cholesterol/gamma-HCH transport system permease protein